MNGARKRGPDRKPRARGVERKPQLTPRALAGLAHMVALVGDAWPVPLEHAETVAAAREWIARTLAHHASATAAAKRAANVASVQAARQKVTP